MITLDTIATPDMLYMTGYGEWAPFQRSLGRPLRDTNGSDMFYVDGSKNLLLIVRRTPDDTVYVFTRPQAPKKEGKL